MVGRRSDEDMISSPQQNWLIWLGVAFLVSGFCALGLHASCLLLECGPPRDWLPLLVPFITIAALIVGYYIWIDQTKLKRRFEVAEKAMLVAIAADDLLSYARTDASYAGEAKDRLKDSAGESEDVARIRDRWFICLKRLGDGRDKLLALREVELLCGLYLGKEAKDAIAEFSAIANTVSISASMLISSAHDIANIRYLLPEQAQSLNALVKQWEVDCSRFQVLYDEKWKAIPNSNRLNVRTEAARAKLKEACARYLDTSDLWASNSDGPQPRREEANHKVF